MSAVSLLVCWSSNNTIPPTCCLMAVVVVGGGEQKAVRPSTREGKRETGRTKGGKCLGHDLGEGNEGKGRGGDGRGERMSMGE